MKHSLKTADFLLLPLVALATVLAVCLGGEKVARVLMPQHIIETCNAHSAFGFTPECMEEMKVAEGPRVTMRFNDCGSRSPHACLMKPAKAGRVVVLGTSIARGYGVRQENMYSARAETLLVRRCRHPVDIQNLSITWPGPLNDTAWETLEASFSKARSLRPDILILFVAPYDLHTYDPGAQGPALGPAVAPAGRTHNAPALITTLIRKVGEQREQSRAILAVRHLLYQDRRVLLERALQDRDGTDYLRAPLTAAWQARLQMFDHVAAELEASAKRSGVPGVIVYTPYEAQVVAARLENGGGDLKPYQLSAAIRDIAARHALRFIDTLPDFVRSPVTQTNFYTVNSHPNAAGHAVIGHSIATGLGYRACALAGA